MVLHTTQSVIHHIHVSIKCKIYNGFYSKTFCTGTRKKYLHNSFTARNVKFIRQLFNLKCKTALNTYMDSPSYHKLKIPILIKQNTIS